MFTTGQCIGNYRVEGLLGQGGMGAVFLAVHRDIERRVAIKVLHPHLARDPHVANRFLNEARAVNLVDHPGLVQVSDFGRLPDGTTFIVMEYLKGESLRARLDQVAQSGGPRLDALLLARQIAAALQAAHQRGVIHRDLKPDNVMLVPDPHAPGGERVKVLDFGIAKLADPPASAEATGHGGPLRTVTGMILGSPIYMAPEQARGLGAGDLPEALFARADVYSLGVMLYQMLAGKPPFVAQVTGDVLAMHILCEPPPLSQYRPSLDPRLHTLVHTLLAKDPAHRPDMGQVVALLSQLSDATGPTLARGPLPLPRVPVATATPSTLDRAAGQSISAPYRAPGVPRTGRTTTVLLGMAMAAGVLGAGGMRIARPPRTVPEVGLRVLRDFHDAGGAARSLLKEPDAWEAAAADFARAVAQPGTPLGWRSGQAFCTGQALLLRGDVRGAQGALRRAVELEDGFAEAHLGLAEALERAGDQRGALGEVLRAEELEPTWWVPVATGAAMHAHAQQLDDAIQGYRRALVLRPEEPAVLDGLALVLHAARLDPEADALAERALARDPDLVWSRVLRAEQALERGDGKTALAEATRAVSLSPRTTAAQLLRADALALLHRDAEALDGYRRLLSEVEVTGGLDLPAGRLTVVRAALSAGRLPPPRSGAKSVVTSQPPVRPPL